MSCALLVSGWKKCDRASVDERTQEKAVNGGAYRGLSAGDKTSRGAHVGKSSARHHRWQFSRKSMHTALHPCTKVESSPPFYKLIIIEPEYTLNCS
jgi:hypothetical protein